MTFHYAVNFSKTVKHLKSLGIMINQELVISDSFQGNYSSSKQELKFRERVFIEKNFTKSSCFVIDAFCQ